ncbi:MAG: VWA domain-containing protein [Blastocatellia bacterium]|nr:VWA domain-containing protein [Blastocatellia bacterium]
MRTRRFFQYRILTFLLLGTAVFWSTMLAFEQPAQGSAGFRQQPEAAKPQTEPQTDKSSDAPPPPPPETKKNQEDVPVVRVNTSLVTMTVTVTDGAGRFVTGLEKEHFEVYDEKVLQKITNFSDDDAPISVGVIFDLSGSMRGRIARSQEALRRFLDTCHEEDEFFLVGFNSTAKLLSDFTPNGERLASLLMMAETKGQTALFDAAYIGVEKVRQGRHTRRALVLISDGQDNNSRYSYRELKQLVKETDVQIYAIGITNVFSGTTLDMQGQTILEELSRLTGGRAFFPNSDTEMQEVITRIGLELRHQYSLGYSPTYEGNDSKWRKIQVKIKPPKGLPHLNVRAKEGYFPSSLGTQ